MNVVKEWKYKDYRCYAIKMEKWSKHHCGYVVLPPGHPDHGKDYDDISVNVHGGLTYAQDGDTRAEHDYPGKDAGYTLGWNCAHLGDASHPNGSFLGVDTADIGGRPNHYWTVEEVATETEHLVDQLCRPVLLRRVMNIWNHGRFWRMLRNIIH